MLNGTGGLFTPFRITWRENNSAGYTMKHVNYFHWGSRGLWGHGKGFLTLMGKIRNPSPGKLVVSQYFGRWVENGQVKRIGTHAISQQTRASNLRSSFRCHLLTRPFLIILFSIILHFTFPISFLASIFLHVAYRSYRLLLIYVFIGFYHLFPPTRIYAPLRQVFPPLVFCSLLCLKNLEYCF